MQLESLQQFQQEAARTLQECQKMSGSSGGQDMKLQVFQLQRQINDLEYNSTQQEAKQKRKYEEELNRLRKSLEAQF